MTVAQWPSDLPKCSLRDSLAVPTRDGRLFSETDTGPGKTRLVNSSAARQVPIQLRLDRNKVARLERFWFETLQRGALPFLFQDQLYDGVILTDENDVVLTDEADVILLSTDWWMARFASKSGPVFAPIGKKCIASFVLDILP